jgi:hypothetical protein
MNWIIQSKDGSISEIKHYTTEDDFRAALGDLFGDSKRKFISATLYDGTVLDEAGAKEWLGGGGGFGIGVTPLGEGPGLG